MKRLIQECIIVAMACLFLPGCGNRDVRKSLRDVEAMLDDRPAEALAELEKIDSSSLKYTPLKMRYDLIYSIALDKNHIDDGRFVREIERAALWYEKYGSRSNKLRSKYYYGDQLRGAGRLEEAAVQFICSEKEAVNQKNWFLAGMSARSLYYVFGRTHNYPEELSCIERAIDYYRLAGKGVHEDDARIKLSVAYFDNSQIEMADSLFNASIALAVQKSDTVRYKLSMVNSVDVFLCEPNIRPDSVIVRLQKAEEVGYFPNAIAFANYGLAYALKGDSQMSERMFELAYSCSKNEREKAFVSERDYKNHLSQGDSSEAFRLLRYLYDYVNKEARITLEQSVVKAQNNYFESVADKLIQERRVRHLFSFCAIIVVLTLIVLMYLLYKRRYERIRKEEIKCDQFKFSCEELGSLGFKSFDKIVEECYSLGKNGQNALTKAYNRLVSQYQSEDKFNHTFISRVDKCHDFVITRLKEEIPELSDSQVLLFACMVQNLSYTTMTVLTANKERQYLYDRKQSLIKKINDKDPDDKELFLSYLQKRPTRVK